MDVSQRCYFKMALKIAVAPSPSNPLAIAKGPAFYLSVCLENVPVHSEAR